MKEPWSIKSRAHECSATNQKFDPGQKIRAAIFPDPESSGYLRKDFTLDAWKARDDQAEIPFSAWTTVYHPPETEEKAEDTVTDDPEILLARLVEADEEHTEKARYILAVMLERKKLLRETDTQKIETGLMRVYEHRKTGDVYLIKDPQIPLSDIEKVQQEVSDLLDAKPPNTAEEPPSETPAETTAPAPEPETEATP